MEPVVTLVTRRAASSDDLSAQDYRDIYDELRSKASLDKFVSVIGSAVSKAWWSKYERSEAELTHDRRNELRTAVGLPTLPPTVTAVTAGIAPDATVYQVGDGTPDRVVMVGDQAHEPLTMRLNGSLQILPADPPEITHVTPVTSPRRERSTKSLSVSISTWKRLSAARKSAGLTWDAYVARAEHMDDLVAALREVDRWLEPDPDAMNDAEHWGEYERLAATVRSALDAIQETS